MLTLQGTLCLLLKSLVPDIVLAAIPMQYSRFGSKLLIIS